MLRHITLAFALRDGSKAAARLSTAPTRLPIVVIGGLGADALAQHLAQGGWPPVLLQQVAKRFIRELLDGLPPILRQPVARLPRGRVAGHSAPNNSTGH